MRAELQVPGKKRIRDERCQSFKGIEPYRNRDFGLAWGCSFPVSLTLVTRILTCLARDLGSGSRQKHGDRVNKDEGAT